MSTEHEFNEVEAMLQRFEPMASSVNRDTLMYRAGWTAAKSQMRGAPPWLWPATSAALAAALLLTLTIPRANPLQRAETEPHEPTHTAAHEIPPRVEPQKEFKLVRAVPVALKRYSPTAPFLVMRERALRGEFADTVTSAEVDVMRVSPAKSRRELLREYLPAGDPPAEAGSSGWFGFSWGGTS